MDIILFKFDKRKNSTKVPSTGTGLTISNVYLKEETSVSNPTFKLSFNVDVVAYNYVYAWDRYYYIDDKISTEHNHWEIVCSLDLLGTYRQNILNTTAYVLYSASNYNIHIPDPRLDVSNDIQESNTYYDISNIFSPTHGTYVLQTVGNSGNSVGGFATAYAGTDIAISQIATYFTTTQAIWEELQKKFTSAYDGIIACYWTPINLQQYANNGTGATVKIGEFDSGVAMYRLTTGVINGVVSLNIPWFYSDFRNCEPYTTIAIYLPVVGVLDMSASDLYGATNIQVSYAIDLVSGDVAYKIAALPGDILLQTAGGNMRVNLPIAQNSADIVGVLSGVGTVIAGVGATVATGGMGALAMTVGGAANAALSANKRGISTSGGYGGRAGATLEPNIRLMVYSKITSQSPSSMINPLGRPSGRTLALSTLSGYVQTLNASIPAIGPGNELDSVNSLLDGGVYIE